MRPPYSVNNIYTLSLRRGIRLSNFLLSV